MAEPKKNIYFASDFHLGVPDHENSLFREKLFIQWLTTIENDAAEIYLMGDLFDFWFEYKTVVPKGFVRVLGKLASLTDKGIPIHFFRGNHDIWAFDYLEREAGMQLYRKPEVKVIENKTFFLAHGDGLGPGDEGYKLLKKIFENKINQFLFRWLHPDIGSRLGLYFSKKSRIANIAREAKNDFKVDIESEMLFSFCRETLKTHPSVDYFIFGHRHFPIVHSLNTQSKMVLLGDWVTNFTYAIFDGNELKLRSFNPDQHHTHQ